MERYLAWVLVRYVGPDALPLIRLWGGRWDTWRRAWSIPGARVKTRKGSVCGAFRSAERRLTEMGCVVHYQWSQLLREGGMAA